MTAPLKWGNEFLVNTATAGDQHRPAAAGLANGQYVAIWQDKGAGEKIVARVYNADGSAATGPINVGTGAASAYDGPSVVGLKDGRFVVVWEDESGGNSDIKGRIYGSDGIAQGAAFTVNTSTANGQYDPAITALTDGGFAVTWHSGDQDAGDYNIRARAYNSSGVAAGDDFLVDDSISEEHLPKIAGLSNGDYVIAWMDGGDAGDGETDGDHAHVRAQIFSGNGVEESDEFVVNTTTEGPQFDPSVAAMPNGTFVVSWTDGDQVGGDSYANPEVYARVFKNSGTPHGDDFSIDTFTVAVNDSQDSAVTGLSDGSFLIAWDGAEIGTMVLQQFENGGILSSGDGVANTTTNGGQGAPAVARLADGRVVTLWTDFGPNPGDASGSAVRGQILDPREGGDAGGPGVTLFATFALNNQLIGTSKDDTITGGAGVDTFYGMGGNDKLKGGGGADILVGGAGDDWFRVDNASDQTIEAIGGGANDRVFASVNYALGAGQEIEILTTSDHSGTSALTLTGNEFANNIYGNAGANKFKGAGGADTLVGFGGDDWFYVTDATDAVVEGAGEGATDRVLATLSYTLGANAQVEMLTTTNNGGTTAINLTGNGFVNAIYGNAGANTLDGKGGADSLSGFGGDDWFHVDNAADAVFEAAGEGNDRVFATVNYKLGTGVQVETLSTDSGAGLANLNLTGNELVNTVAGNAGSNGVTGLLGNDMLYGGGGADSFVFNTALNAATNMDTVLDFTAADDTFLLSSGIFTTIAVGTLAAGAFAIGAAATQADDRIVYNNATGALFYDADGVNGVAQVQFAVLSGAPVISNVDFMIV